MPRWFLPTSSCDQIGNSPLFVIRENGKYGYINSQGTIKIQPGFTWAYPFSDDLASVAIGQRDDCKWGYIDKSGEIVIEAQFWNAMSFSEGLACVKTLNDDTYLCPAWQFIDTNGDICFEQKYENSESFSEGLALGLISIFTDQECKDINIFEEVDISVFLFREFNYEYIDKSGETVISSEKIQQFVCCNSFKEGLARFNACYRLEETEIGNWGFIDQSGDIIIQPRFDEAGDFSEGLASVMTGYDEEEFIMGTWGYIDKCGHDVIPSMFVYANNFCEGIAGASIMVDGCEKFGFIDTAGKWVIDPQFRNTFQFNEELAPAQIDNRQWGFIDKSGVFVIQPQFEDVRSFHNGLAAVCIDDRWGYIDKAGDFVWSPTA